MIIQIEVKNVYGKDLFYPCNFINELQALTESKT